MSRLLSVGEVMGELRRSDEGFALGFAGDTYNAAVYARRADPSLPVGYVSAVGEDPLSQGLIEAAEDEGIDASRIRRDPARQIGLYSVSTDAAGERSFHYWRAQSAARAMFDDGVPAGTFDGAEVVLLSGITLAILPPPARTALLDALAAAPARVAFDSNYRPALWDDAAAARDAFVAAFRVADIALPSLDDMAALWGDDEATALRRLEAWGVAEGALKCGEGGPVGLDGTRPEGCGPAERVVDTTAAGDSFDGAYLASRLAGLDTVSAMRAGHAMARVVVGHPGAIVPRDATAPAALKSE